MNTLTLGSIVIALAILYANLRPWWKGGRDPKALAPYGAGSALGSIATICIGGALGWGTAGIAGLSSSFGDKGIRTTTGTGSAPVSTGRMGTLTPEGGAVVVLLLVIVVLMFKAAGKQDKRRIIGGFVSFGILGFLPGVAALLSWWPDTVNGAGAWIVAALETGKGLL